MAKQSGPYISPNEPLYLRTSLIKAYLKCPAFAFFRYFKGLVVMPRSYITLGSCFHLSAEHHYKYKLKKGKNSKLSVLQDIFHESFKQKRKYTQWTKEEKPDELENEGIKLMLPAYYEKRAVKLEPKYVEENFQVEVPGCKTILTGQIDLVEQGDRIRDHKTRQRKPNWMEAIKSLQGLSYTAGFYAKFKRKPKSFTLDYILRKKGATEIDSSKPVVHTEGETKGFFDTVRRVEASIRAGLFYPRAEGNYLCSPNTCGFWDICQRKQAWRDLGPFTKVFGSNQAVDDKAEEDDA